MFWLDSAHCMQARRCLWVMHARQTPPMQSTASRDQGTKREIRVLVRTQSCGTCSHRCANGFTPDERILVKSHNSFLDKISCKVAWFCRVPFCGV